MMSSGDRDNQQPWKIDEVTALESGAVPRSRAVPTGTVIDTMVQADVDGAADLSDKIHESGLMRAWPPVYRVTPLPMLLAIEAEAIQDETKKARLDYLKDLAAAAAIMSCMPTLDGEKRSALLSLGIGHLNAIELTDYDRSVLESMMNHAGQSNA